MKSSPLARTIQLAKLGAQIGLKELRSKDLQSRIEQAKLIAQSLSQLKGAAMKAGQLLSLDLDDYFPKEAIEILSQLQNAATAIPLSEIEEIISSELGAEKKKLIDSIEERPIGIASIGQVHKARYGNRNIVLKVQFKDVARSVDSDLKILKLIANSFCQLTGKKMNLDPLFLEFKSVLEQELDYEQEASYQDLFREKIKALNQKSICKFRVPESIKELSTKKVLAMSFEEGQTLRNWVNTNPPQSQKQIVASAILDLYFHEFFEWGLVQTDPNWGNFLIDGSDSNLSICLLDFGSTKRFDKQFIRNYISLLESAANGNTKILKQLSVELKLIDPREPEEAFEAFELMLKTAIKPFSKNESEDGTYFDFANQSYLSESQKAVRALSEKLIYSPPPYPIIFLHRKLAGVFSILKALNVRIDISPYWQTMKDLSQKD